MSLGKLTFPAEGLSSCVDDSRWEQRSEDVLPVLRQFAMKSPVIDIDAKSEHAKLAAAFLLGIYERRRTHRARVVETAKALARSKCWEEMLQTYPLLLPPVVQAEASVLLATTSAEQEMATVSDFPQVSESLSSVPIAARQVAAEPACLPKEQTQEIPSLFEDIALIDVPVTEQLHLAVQAILAIDTHTLFENWSISAFAQFRKAVLHVATLPALEMIDAIDEEAAHGVEVLNYMVDIVKGSPIRNNQVCEVLGILLQCPGWQKAAGSSPALMNRISHHDTTPEVMACFKKIELEMGKQNRGSFLQKLKRLRRWLHGCGQKDGHGVSSPAAVAREGAVADRCCLRQMGR